MDLGPASQSVSQHFSSGACLPQLAGWIVVVIDILPCVSNYFVFVQGVFLWLYSLWLFVPDIHLICTLQELQILARADCLHREHCTCLVTVFVREATVQFEGCRSFHRAMASLATAVQTFYLQWKAVLKSAWVMLQVSLVY